MTVFKTFLKILNKNKFIIILYTLFLIFFGGFNMQTSEHNTNFVASKPDIMIVNYDEEKGITKDLIKYIEENSNVVDLKNNEDAINDALFYRDVNYVIYIPKNYNKDFMDGKNPEIEIKSTGDYQSSFAEMLLSRYIKVANIYQKSINSEEELISKINETLSKKSEVEITSKLDTNILSKATFYYNFANYSIMACLIYVICLILASFKDIKIQKRTIISSTNYKTLNRQLLLSNSLFSIILWMIYVVLSFILVGDIMFSIHGIFYLINSFVFTICATTIALFIGNIVSNKNAISGIVNVIALGSSFLCGAFVPMEWLPEAVIKIAHILPSYYYISNNEILKTLEIINFNTIKPILLNIIIILSFSIIFIILTNIVSKRKQKIG
ncbi:MAG: ABC transporter permease [Firmicutes bacterium]|nr:ABC transporter permease [Bacillota bacterium]